MGVSQVKKKKASGPIPSEAAAMAAGMSSLQGQQTVESGFSGSSQGRFRQGPASLYLCGF